MASKEPPSKDAPRGGGMQDFFVGLFTGVFLCGLVGGYYVVRTKPAVRHAQDTTAAAIQHAVTAFDAKLEAWHLTTRDIERELTQTGKIVRRQMSDFGTAIADSANDATITGKIKAKLALDKDLNGFSIGVTTTEGRVTLTGNVTTPKQISHAIVLALEADGVREVASTLKVKR
jgi:osmotically-inducible protein OsmY